MTANPQVFISGSASGGLCAAGGGRAGRAALLRRGPEAAGFGDWAACRMLGAEGPPTFRGVRPPPRAGALMLHSGFQGGGASPCIRIRERAAGGNTTALSTSKHRAAVCRFMQTACRLPITSGVQERKNGRATGIFGDSLWGRSLGTIGDFCEIRR